MSPSLDSSMSFESPDPTTIEQDDVITCGGKQFQVLKSNDAIFKPGERPGVYNQNEVGHGGHGVVLFVTEKVELAITTAAKNLAVPAESTSVRDKAHGRHKGRGRGTSRSISRGTSSKTSKASKKVKKPSSQSKAEPEVLAMKIDRKMDGEYSKGKSIAGSKVFECGVLRMLEQLDPALPVPKCKADGLSYKVNDDPLDYKYHTFVMTAAIGAESMVRKDAIERFAEDSGRRNHFTRDCVRLLLALLDANIFPNDSEAVIDEDGRLHIIDWGAASFPTSAKTMLAMMSTWPGIDELTTTLKKKWQGTTGTLPDWWPSFKKDLVRSWEEEAAAWDARRGTQLASDAKYLIREYWEKKWPGDPLQWPTSA